MGGIFSPESQILRGLSLQRGSSFLVMGIGGCTIFQQNKTMDAIRPERIMVGEGERMGQGKLPQVGPCGGEERKMAMWKIYYWSRKNPLPKSSEIL